MTGSRGRRPALLLLVGVLALLLSACAGPGDGGSRAEAEEPADSGQLPWVGDFETGDLSQYTDEPTNDVGGVPPRVVTDPVRDGRYAVELTVRGSTTAAAGICCGTRNELVPRFRDLAEGDDLYFGFSSYLAPGFPTDPPWQVITQFKQNFDGTPPLSLNVEQNEYLMEGGYGHPAGPRPFGRPIGPVRTGVWEDWVIHVHFSTDPAVGFFEVWRGGRLVVPRFHPPGGTLYPATGDQVGSYVKTGPYRDPSVSVPATLYLDDWRIGTSYSVVARPATS